MANGGRKDDEYRVVFSTDEGSHCAECGKARPKCTCVADRERKVLGDGNVRIRRETKGRGGKTVTTVSGLAVTQVELEKMLKDFKRLCGAGGAMKDGVLEIQGDHCDVLLKECQRRGIHAKRAGG